MSLSIHEDEHDFQTYTELALQAAALGKIADCNYYLEQASLMARALGWEAWCEKLIAVSDECRQLRMIDA